ncbi:MAG: hypothetical protein A3E78_11110 [Alphaproteobacteria bacterium RIFCSPHIGHO2_12_FULL_63_12]|nr:MAG: hypothetical protein A3E78_11110 [Alphaproteobacteria bacterium RIFCSPHIGHO2_12_FULL_63_12]
MKFLFAFAALLLAISSVSAEASQSCERWEAAASTTAAAMPAGDTPCHEPVDHTGDAPELGCAVAAHCAMLCGVTPPAEFDADFAAQFVALSFVTSADHLAGALRAPEAPPPRPVFL